MNSCQVESALLRRQLPFRWRMVSTFMVWFVIEFDVFLQVPYLIGRTCFLVTLILSSVRLRQYSVLVLIQFQLRDQRRYPVPYRLLL